MTMTLNKFPGPDGLSGTFYKFAGMYIKVIL